MTAFDSNVDLVIKAMFGANPLNVDWTDPTADITDRVRSWHARRGRQYELDQVEAGTLSFVADNSDGFLNPGNTQSDFYPNVRPMTPIRIEATYNSVTYPVYTGFVESWPPSFPAVGKDAVVSPASVDAFEVFANQRLRGFWPDIVDGDGPIAWYRFADTSDETGNGHTLSYNGTPVEDVDGAWSGDLAVTFDGTDDYATVTNEGDLELLADMSFELWFRPTVATIQTVDTFNADDTWTAPAGVTQATIECYGPGGGGEAGTVADHAGGGGGGGAYARSVVEVTPGNNYTINIGTAGAAGTGSGGNGGNATDTIFGSNLVVADGGAGGGTAGKGQGGAGGQASASTGTVRRSGGSGGDSPGLNDPSGAAEPGGGGGGGEAGSSAQNGDSGNDGTSSAGGAGGSGGAGGNGGNGGNPGPPATNGAAGSAPGGGGGGGGSSLEPSGGSDGDGGAGAAGRIVVTYIEPVNQVIFSCRGSSVLYQLMFDGFDLWFAPGTSAGNYQPLGECTPEEWHHVVVTIDWDGSNRIIKGTLDGIQTLDLTTSHQPAVEARAVNIGRRATAGDQWFSGDISELVFYDRVLTPTEIQEHYNGNAESLPAQLTSERVSGVLDVVGWLSGESISTGLTTIQAIAASTDDSALDAIRDAVDAERGLFFIGPDGLPVFRDRHYRLLNQAASQATFSDDGTDLPYADIVFSYDLEHMANDITVTDGTNSHQLRSEESIDKYGVKEASFTMLTNDPNELVDAAQFLLGKLSEPALRVDSIIITPRRDVDLWPQILGLDIGDRITIRKTLTGDDINADFHIEAVSHEVSAGKTWITTWQLSPASSDAFWVLGVAGLSELGETTVLGY